MHNNNLNRHKFVWFQNETVSERKTPLTQTNFASRIPCAGLSVCTVMIWSISYLILFVYLRFGSRLATSPSGEGWFPSWVSTSTPGWLSVIPVCQEMSVSRSERSEFWKSNQIVQTQTTKIQHLWLYHRVCFWLQESMFPGIFSCPICKQPRCTCLWKRISCNRWAQARFRTVLTFTLLYLFLSIFHPEGTGYQTVWIPYSQGFGGIEGCKGSTARTEVCLYPPMAVC